MDGATIAMFAFQLVITTILGIAAWGIKNALSGITNNMTELKAADKANTERIEKVRSELNDLKADLPLLYVTREDFIRVANSMDAGLNKVDAKIDKVLYKLNPREG